MIDITNVKIDSTDNLLDNKLNILDADFIYIFTELEKIFDLPIFEIFKDSTFEIMKISNLSKKIMDLARKTC